MSFITEAQYIKTKMIRSRYKEKLSFYVQIIGIRSLLVSFSKKPEIAACIIVLILCVYTNGYAQQIPPNEPVKDSRMGVNADNLSGSLDAETRVLLIESNRRSLMMHRKMIEEYGFLQKLTSRDKDKNGRVRGETVKTFEVFAVPNRTSVLVQTSENGVSFSPERIAKERERAGKQLEKFYAEDSKRSAQQDSASTEKGKWLSLTITSKSLFRSASFTINPQNFLRASSFHNPRREEFRGCNMLIVEFSPNDSFLPETEGDNIAAKLSGRMWIDLSEKVIVRLEASAFNVAKKDEFKSGKVELAGDPVFIYDQMRFAEGLWFPKLLFFDSSSNESLFRGINVSSTMEFYDFKRFVTEIKDVTTNP